MRRQIAVQGPHGPRTVRLHAYGNLFRGLTLVHLTDPLFWMHHAVSHLVLYHNGRGSS